MPSSKEKNLLFYFCVDLLPSYFKFWMEFIHYGNGTEVAALFVCFGNLAGGFPQVLEASTIFSQVVHNMTVCLFKASGRIFSYMLRWSYII